MSALIFEKKETGVNFTHHGSTTKRYFTFIEIHSYKQIIMIAMINRILDWIKSLFWKEEMELTLVGLQFSGKTTFVNVIAVSYCKQWFIIMICIVI